MALVKKDKIEAYIKENGYTWSYNSIMIEYEKYKNKEYISHTAKDVIINCIENESYIPKIKYFDKHQSKQAIEYLEKEIVDNLSEKAQNAFKCIVWNLKQKEEQNTLLSEQLLKIKNGIE